MVRPRLTIALLLAGLTGSTSARAAAPWIYRDLVLPRHDIAVDLGFGIGQTPTGPSSSIMGTGLNLELTAGVSRDFELGFRLGFRLDDGGQITQADRYARPFDSETFDTNPGRVANPELRFRWAVARGAAAELGLELRVYLPIEADAHFGLMFGLPIALRAGPIRFDTGIFIPVLFDDPTVTIVSVPLQVWIQATYRLWFGPLFELRIVNDGGGSHTESPLGFGLGTALGRAVDLKAWFVFEDVNQNRAARSFGAGVALQLRFE